MVGATLAHYHISGVLGAGGMGEVYRATDTRLEREVALKVLPPGTAGSAERLERFQREAKALAALHHPGIVTIYSVEEAEGLHFLTMELVEGRRLDELIPSGGMEIGEILLLAAQLSEALVSAHDNGVVHRDLKPSNVMVDASGCVKVLDFGLAKVRTTSAELEVSQLHTEALTGIGTISGTIPYMSPEQVEGLAVDQRTDVFSFGVLLYEMVTGVRPFQGSTAPALISSILKDEPPPLADVRPDLPAGLDEIVAWCLEKNVAERSQSMRAVLGEIVALAGDLGLAVTPGEAASSSTAPRRTAGLQPRSMARHADTVKDAGGVPGRMSGGQGGLRRARARGVAAVVLATVAAIAVVLLGAGHTIERWLGLSPAARGRHVVVLQLTNVDGDPQLQALCDGLMETLTSKLTEMERYNRSLWVVPSSEVLRDKVASAGDARRVFGANLAVSGSLQRLGSRFRLTLNLIDAESLRQIDSAVVDVEASDLSRVQDVSVRKLRAMMDLEIGDAGSESESKAPTSAPGAYQFYLQARGYMLRYEKTENIDLAIGLYQRAIELDGDFAEAHAGLGRAYWLKYQALEDTALVAKAVAECRRAADLDSSLAPVNVTLGLIHSGTGDYDEAVDDFHRALAEDPDDADAFRGLARAYEAQKKVSQAEATYRKAIELKPDYWAGYNDLGTFYYRHERYDEAAAQFRQVVALTPDNYRGYNNLGAIYYLLERWESAEEMFGRSFALHTSYSVASNLGTLYFIEGKYEDAVAMYQKALQLNDKDPLVWGNLAAAYERSRDEPNKARDAYRRAADLAEANLKVNPHDPELIARLAGYCAGCGDKERAASLLKQALQLAPDDAAVMYSAGSTYEELNQRREAIRWIVAALRHGYSRSEIEHEPSLQKLLADPRFKNAMASDR